MNKAEILGNAITAVAHQWIDEGKVSVVQDITDGILGYRFYLAVETYLGQKTSKDLNLRFVKLEKLFGANSNWEMVLDRQKVSELSVGEALPAGYHWADLDEAAVLCQWVVSKACWITMDSRHYDAESPNGVDHPFELQKFRRDLQAV